LPKVTGLGVFEEGWKYHHIITKGLEYGKEK